jgi:hypothetical protein
MLLLTLMFLLKLSSAGSFGAKEGLPDVLPGGKYSHTLRHTHAMAANSEGEGAPAASAVVEAAETTEKWVHSTNSEVRTLFTKREQEILLRHLPPEEEWRECLSPASELMPVEGRIQNLATLSQRWNGPSSSMASIAQALGRYNLTMVVVGDSLTGQFHEASRCSLRRHGWKPQPKKKRSLESLGYCSTVGQDIETYLDGNDRSFSFGVCRITNHQGAFEEATLGKLFEHADVVVSNE